jgi:hypothetical protein
VSLSRGDQHRPRGTPLVWAYFDSSAVVKVYVQEGGRAAVLRLLRQHEVVVSAILPVEIRGALRRRAAENVIESSRLPSALQQFAKDVPNGTCSLCQQKFWSVLNRSYSPNTGRNPHRVSAGVCRAVTSTCAVHQRRPPADCSRRCGRIDSATSGTPK